MTAQVLVITDTPELMRAVRACLGSSGSIETSGILWSQATTFLSAELVKESDLVIAELHRTYPTGRRAEAIVLAERFLSHTPFLILAPNFLAEKINCPAYWDVATAETLRSRAARLIRSPGEASKNFDRLKDHFARELTLPKQH